MPSTSPEEPLKVGAITLLPSVAMTKAFGRKTANALLWMLATLNERDYTSK
jgi:hypothetical protein